MSLQPSLRQDHVYTCRLLSTLIAHRRKYTHMARLGCRGRPMNLTDSQERHLGPARDPLRTLAASPSNASTTSQASLNARTTCACAWHSILTLLYSNGESPGACGCGSIRPWHRTSLSDPVTSVFKASFNDLRIQTSHTAVQSIPEDGGC